MRRQLTKLKMPPGVRERWRKIYKGKMYQYRGTYSECLEQWRKEKEEFDRPKAEPVSEELEMLGRELECEGIGLRKVAAVAKMHGNEAWAAEVLTSVRQGRSKGKTTLGKAIEQYLVRQAAIVSIGQVENNRRALADFAKFADKRTALANISGKELEAYNLELLGRVKDGQSKSYAAFHCRNVKAFFNWALDVELIEKLPRSRLLSVEATIQKVKTFDNDELKTLLTNATERMRLYLLLMLNCGMTQKDVADLRPSEVDYKAGRITRKRSKTKDFENVPTVEYLLWKETHALLKKFGHRTGALALTNEDGGALKTEAYNDGKYQKFDNIASGYHRLIQKLKAKKITVAKPLKCLRKTSPTRLFSNPQFAHLAQHFLGHSPKSVAERHYIGQITFDEALQWLGKQYGIK